MSKENLPISVDNNKSLAEKRKEKLYAQNPRFSEIEKKKEILNK